MVSGYSKLRSGDFRFADADIRWLLVLFAGLLNLLFVNNEFWQDELYTMQNFVFVPLHTTLTDYHIPNNHIVFSFLMSVYVKLTGIQYETALQEPWLLRSIPYLLTLAGVYIFYSRIDRVFDRATANIAGVVYVTCLQLYTFGTQLRGYSLEILLLMIFMLSLSGMLKKSVGKLNTALVVAGALLMINLPSTLYYYCAVLTMLFGFFFYYYTAKRRIKATTAGFAFLSSFLGILVAVSYFTILIGIGQLTGNQIFAPVPYNLLKLIILPFFVGGMFTDFRIFLPLIVLAGLLWKKSWRKLGTIELFLLGQYFISYLFFAIHNPVNVFRIWVVFLPLFSLLVALYLGAFRLNLQKRFLSFSLACVAALVISLVVLRHSSYNLHVQDRVTLDLRYQYHLFGYHPRAVLDSAFREAGEINARIEFCEDFQGGIVFYKKLFDLDSVNNANAMSSKIIIISNGDKELKRLYPHRSLRMNTRDSTSFYRRYYID